MKISRMLEAVGLGAAREARLLVARLPRTGMSVATVEEPIARALVRGKHQRAALEGSDAEAALSLALPDGDEGLARVEQLAAATRDRGIVTIVQSADRARVAGLMLRAGLAELRQESDGGTVFTTGRVRRAPASH